VVEAGKAGIEAATNMVNGVIERFGDIDDLMDEWVESITGTKEAIDISDDRLDHGTPESVRLGIDDIVNSFKEMFDATKFTIDNLKTFGNDIVELCEKELAEAEKAAKYARDENPTIQESFEYVEEAVGWEDFEL